MKIPPLAITPKRAALVAIVAAIGAQPSARAATFTHELLSNGHFESPALAGDGQVWSTDPTFSLPGWTYPMGTNQCYLEYGHHLGAARYSDGRQALCLHGQGTPVSISQMFNTISGLNYTISLAQNDENNAGPSASQITLSVSGMSPRVLGNWGTYHEYDDHGSVPQVLIFTATSNLTTLTITDTSPAGAPSPLIDAVCVNPSSGQVIRSGRPVPGHLFNFASFGTPVLSGDRAIYIPIYSAKASTGYSGIWTGDGYCSNGIPQIVTNPPPPTPLVDTAAAIPGGSGTFSMFSPGSLVSLNPQPLPPGRTASMFWAGGSGGQQGFYAAAAGQAGSSRVADMNTVMPNHAGATFATFLTVPTNLTTQAASDGSNLVIWGAGADDWEGLYCGSVPFFVGGTNPPPPPPQLSVVADRSTVLPGSADTFATFVNTNAGAVLWPPNHLAINGNDVVFYGASVGGIQGLYCAPVPPIGGVSPYVLRLVDTTIFPTNCCMFNGFGTFDLASASGRLNVAFVGTGPGGQQGVYDEDVPICPPYVPVQPPVPGPIWTLADTNTPIPQGTGNFIGFAGVACGGPDGISIAFVGMGTNGQKGIYASPAPSPAGVFPFRLSKVIDLSDTLDGRSIADLQLTAGGVHGCALAYKAMFTDGTQGVYVTPLVQNVVISSMTISNHDVLFSFNAPAGRNFWVLSGTDLGLWDTNAVVNVPGTGGLVDFMASSGFLPSGGSKFYTIRWSGESPDLGALNGFTGRMSKAECQIR